MAVTYQDILDAICSHASLITSNSNQSSFAIDAAQEAQLAYDVLAAHGFDVQVYHEDTVSKLYINKPALDSAVVDKKLESALSYAHTLKQVITTMGAVENSNYQISFANTPTLGKQISIYFPPVSTFSEESASAAPPARPVITRPVAQQAARHKKPYTNKPKERKSEILATGPALAKQYPLGIKPPTTHEDSFMKWLSTYIFSNFTESFYAFFGLGFTILVIISILVMLKGFVCPDLATVKSREWYCNLTFSKEEPQ